MAQNCPYWKVGNCLPPRQTDAYPCSWPNPDFENCAVYRTFQPPTLPKHPFKAAYIFVQSEGPVRSPEEAEHLGSEILQALQPGSFLQQIRPKVFVYEWTWRSDEDVKRKAIVTILARGCTQPPETWRVQNGAAYGKKLFIVYLNEVPPAEHKSS